MKACIWAQTSDGIIGLNGKIPWRYPGDFRRFKRVTAGSVVVMGRKTWESIGRPLPNRKNVVITTMGVMERAEDLLTVAHLFDGAIVCNNLHLALIPFDDWPVADTWFIGGRQIYEAAMALVDVIDVTFVPDDVTIPAGAEVVYAPKIDESVFDPGELLQHEDEPALKRRVYVRRTLAEAPYDDASNRRLQELGYMTRR